MVKWPLRIVVFQPQQWDEQGYTISDVKSCQAQLLQGRAMFSLYSNIMKFGSSGGHDRAQRVDRKQRRISNYRQNDPNPRTPLFAAILNASRPRRRGLFIPKYTSSIIWPDFNLVEEISLPLNIECGVRARVRACVRGERRGQEGGSGDEHRQYKAFNSSFAVECSEYVACRQSICYNSTLYTRVSHRVCKLWTTMRRQQWTRVIVTK